MISFTFFIELLQTKLVLTSSTSLGTFVTVLISFSGRKLCYDENLFDFSVNTASLYKASLLHRRQR